VNSPDSIRVAKEPLPSLPDNGVDRPPRIVDAPLMCRNIKTLHNFFPRATNDEIRASSLQFVRKISGFTKPSQANEAAFNLAVDEVAHIAEHLLQSLITTAPPRNRETEAVKARARSGKRFGLAPVGNGTTRV
jgi:hypothetical protein